MFPIAAVLPKRRPQVNRAVGPAPTAPMLIWTSDEANAYPVADVYLDPTAVAGDAIQSQIQAHAGSWTSLIVNVSHIITSGELASGDISITQGFSLPGGTFDWRVRLVRAADGVPSDWSNVETKTLVVHDESGDTAEAKAYFARVRAAGLSLDKTHGDALATAINGLVADGVWATLDYLYLPSAMPSLAHARLNLVSSSFALVNVSAPNDPNFVADKGVKATGIDILSTQFTPSTAGGKYQLNAAHAMVWSDEALDGNGGDMGVLTSTTDYLYVFTKTPSGPGTNAMVVNGQDWDEPYANTTSGKGFYLGVRENNTTRTVYYGDGGTFTNKGTTHSGTTGGLPNDVVYFCGVKGNGPSGKRLRAGSVGGKLTATQAQAFYNRLQTLFTALGNP